MVPHLPVVVAVHRKDEGPHLTDIREPVGQKAFLVALPKTLSYHRGKGFTNGNVVGGGNDLTVCGLSHMKRAVPALLKGPVESKAAVPHCLE
jgi:hypothetical protein